MKKYLSILAFSCLTLCSCDNFLDLTPQSVLTPENAYEKPEDWQQTLYAAYGTLQEVFSGTQRDIPVDALMRHINRRELDGGFPSVGLLLTGIQSLARYTH